jgi:hypothetical protein
MRSLRGGLSRNALAKVCEGVIGPEFTAFLPCLSDSILIDLIEGKYF